MRTVPTLLSGTLAAACFLFFPSAESLRADSFSVDGQTIEGDIVDLVEEGAFVAAGDTGEVVPWDKLTSFQAKDVRILMVNQLRNLRSGAVWIIGTVREVFPEGAVIYADARPRANYGVSLNIPPRDESKPRPRKTRAGAPAVNGWYIVKDLPNPEQMMNETVQMIAYPNGNIEEIQLAEENDPEEIPTVTLALPIWAGMRTWTNMEGVKIEAELVYVTNGNCIFEKSGVTMAYPLAKLIEADQQIAMACEDLAHEVFIDPAATQ